MNALDLVHHLGIDVQPTCGIDDQHIFEPLAGGIERPLCDLERIFIALTGAELGPDLSGYGAQLLNSCRSVHVTTDHQHRFFLFLLQPAGKLGNTGGFTGALQTGHQNHRRRLGGQIEPFIGRAHELDQLIIDNLNQHLSGRQTLGHCLAERLFADILNKLTHHRQRHIRFQQRHAHGAQGVLNIVFAQTTLTAQIGQNRLEAILERLEHERTSIWASGA